MVGEVADATRRRRLKGEGRRDERRWWKRGRGWRVLGEVGEEEEGEEREERTGSTRVEEVVGGRRTSRSESIRERSGEKCKQARIDLLLEFRKAE